VTRPDVVVTGDDPALARVVSDHLGALVEFRPSATSDVARVVGLQAGAQPSHQLALDALRLSGGGLAVNMVVFGTPPDRTHRFTRPLSLTLEVDGTTVNTARATGIVVATGQFLRGLDVVPRGHPGDGRLEVYVFRLRASERRAMRTRLPHGTHVPHPRITVRPGHHVDVVAHQPVALEVDGERRPPVRAFTIDVVERAYRLLV
jgi:putative lipid kinase YegS-like protein